MRLVNGGWLGLRRIAGPYGTFQPRVTAMFEAEATLLNLARVRSKPVR